MTNAITIRVAAVFGFLAVTFGALGAHGGLNDLLKQNATLAIWEKAVFYQFIHAVMLFVLAHRKPVLTGPWLCFLLGILLFSGSLYLLAVTTAKWLAAITPFGGLSFLTGWAWLAISARRSVN